MTRKRRLPAPRPPSRGVRARATLPLLVALVVGTVAVWALRPARRAEPAKVTPPAPMSSTTAFEPTVANTDAPLGQPPEGMVWIPGGEFSMGAPDPPDMDDVGMKATVDSRPIHRVYVDGFWMDTTVVTNEQFAAFVKATRRAPE
jgi:sulfatase modifying factor 1